MAFAAWLPAAPVRCMPFQLWSQPPDPPAASVPAAYAVLMMAMAKRASRSLPPGIYNPNWSSSALSMFCLHCRNTATHASQDRQLLTSGCRNIDMRRSLTKYKMSLSFRYNLYCFLVFIQDACTRTCRFANYRTMSNSETSTMLLHTISFPHRPSLPLPWRLPEESTTTPQLYGSLKVRSCLPGPPAYHEDIYKGYNGQWTKTFCITGIKAKVENKGQYDQYLEELKPLREELGVSLKEDLYPEAAK